MTFSPIRDSSPAPSTPVTLTSFFIFNLSFRYIDLDHDLDPDHDLDNDPDPDTDLDLDPDLDHNLDLNPDPDPDLDLNPDHDLDLIDLNLRHFPNKSLVVDVISIRPLSVILTSTTTTTTTPTPT